MSVTVITKEQVEDLPDPSMARHDTVVTPMGKVAPLGGPPMRATVGTSVQLSVAVGVAYVTAAEEQVLAAVFTVWLPGQELKMGAWVSLTMTRKVQVWVSPTPSAARRVTVVVPLLNVLPLPLPAVKALLVAPL